MTDIATGLQDLFREIFRDDNLVLTPEMTAEDVDGWDSLAHINVIIAVEAEFSIEFANAEISLLKERGQNVGKFLALIEQKMQERG